MHAVFINHASQAQLQQTAHRYAVYGAVPRANLRAQVVGGLALLVVGQRTAFQCRGHLSRRLETRGSVRIGSSFAPFAACKGGLRKFLGTRCAASSASSGIDARAVGATSSANAVLREAELVLEAQRELATRLASARARAQASMPGGKPPAPPAASGLGLEDAPPEVRRRLEALTCGSHPYEPHPGVEALWQSMPASADHFQPAWSPWRLRAVGSSIPQSLHDLRAARAGESCIDMEVAMYASESLQRWFSLATCLAGGMLGGGAPAASEPLQNNIALQHGPRVEAYVTHLTDDDYVIGAVLLGASLISTGTTRPLLALVTDGVSVDGRRKLHEAGWALLDVSLVGDAEEDAQHIRGYFSKIWLWGLPCHRVVYLDTDVIVLENIDELFSEASGCELAAVPDSQPYEDGELVVQAGCLVVEPSLTRFTDLWDVCCGDRRPASLNTWKMHEQGFLSKYFDGNLGIEACGPGNPRTRWQALPATFNFNVRYHLRALYADLTADTVRVVHFACCKPWDPQQRHYAPPAYVRLFLEFARAVGVPWTPGRCHMDELREREQERKIQQMLLDKGEAASQAG